MSKDENIEDITFYLLKEGNQILSMAGLLKVYSVEFKNEKYIVYGVVEMISNIKGKGFGKLVINELIKYIRKKDLTVLGFCHEKNRSFYEKRGFNFSGVKTQRFIYRQGEIQKTNMDGQIIFNLDSSDKFMEKVLTYKNEIVFLPTKNLW